MPNTRYWTEQNPHAIREGRFQEMLSWFRWNQNNWANSVTRSNDRDLILKFSIILIIYL